MSEQQHEQCCRVDCQEQAGGQVMLKSEAFQEPTVYHLCLYHYYEVLQVIQGIRVVLGTPEEQEVPPTK